MKNYIALFVTTPDEETAIKISRILVEGALVACAQINGPITSIYKWEGKICEDREWRLIIKSRNDQFEKIEQVIIQNHPYDVPQIIALPILQAHRPYLNWIDEILDK